MKESDILLSRAEKLRREARSVRNESARLSDAVGRQHLLDIANDLEVHARALDKCARRRATHHETKPRRVGVRATAPVLHET